MFAVYKVQAVRGDEVDALCAPAVFGLPQYRRFTYSAYVTATRSNPQVGDRIDVTDEGRILGLHPEYTDNGR